MGHIHNCNGGHDMEHKLSGCHCLILWVLLDNTSMKNSKWLLHKKAAPLKAVNRRMKRENWLRLVNYQAYELAKPFWSKEVNSANWHHCEKQYEVWSQTITDCQVRNSETNITRRWERAWFSEAALQYFTDASVVCNINRVYICQLWPIWSWPTWQHQIRIKSHKREDRIERIKTNHWRNTHACVQPMFPLVWN